MSSNSKRREGFALAVAMVAIVVIGALIAGAFFTSTQEYRIGRNSLMDQRAFAAAEAGVTQPIQAWVKQLNLSMANNTTTNPDTLQITGGSYAVRRMTRLDDYTFWVTSDGYAGPAGTLASHHKLNAVYRLAYPKFEILGWKSFDQADAYAEAGYAAATQMFPALQKLLPWLDRGRERD